MHWDRGEREMVMHWVRGRGENGHALGSGGGRFPVSRHSIQLQSSGDPDIPRSLDDPDTANIQFFFFFQWCPGQHHKAIIS